jgi:hypothetical protein
MTKNRGAMSKLAATNRMLIDSLNALDSTGGKLQPLREGGGMETNPGTPIAITNNNNISNTSAQNSSRTGRKLSPIRRAVSPMSASTNATNLEFFNDNGTYCMYVCMYVCIVIHNHILNCNYRVPE